MLKSRVITALVLVTVLGYFLFFANALAWQGMILLSALIAGWEWAGLAKICQCFKKYVYAGLVGVIAWLALPVLSASQLSLMTVMMLIGVVLSVLQYQTSQAKTTWLKHSGLILISGLFILVLFSTTLIHFRAQLGAPILFLTLMSIWAIDTGAYFSGRKFGRNKLAVYVSPGKTWEGVIGGGLLSFMINGLGLYLLMPSLSISFLSMALLMTLISLISVFGDLFESLLKREAQLKDSGSIFPGHGGMLDRIDSLLVAIPLFYLLWLSVL